MIIVIITIIVIVITEVSQVPNVVSDSRQRLIRKACRSSGSRLHDRGHEFRMAPADHPAARPSEFRSRTPIVLQSLLGPLDWHRPHILLSEFLVPL